jgi:hypothetical protein
MIRQLKDNILMQQKQYSKLLSESTNKNILTNEFETLFVECTEEVRKDIMKRRLKSEM